MSGIDERLGTIRRYRLFAQSVSVVAMFVGALVLFGWAFDLAALKRFHPAMAQMYPMTAVCFVALGAALWLSQKQSSQIGRAILQRKVAAQTCALLAAFVGTVTLAEYNLLSNAIKFNHEGGKVFIRAEPYHTDRLKLVVNDTGVGIKAEDSERLFKEFEQLDSGASRHYEGTGLGLALTRKIVELQGGTIEMESELGEGSTFTVILPLALNEANI